MLFILNVLNIRNYFIIIHDHFITLNFPLNDQIKKTASKKQSFLFDNMIFFLTQFL